MYVGMRPLSVRRCMAGLLRCLLWILELLSVSMHLWQYKSTAYEPR